MPPTQSLNSSIDEFAAQHSAIRILTESSSEEFPARLRRWSDINRQNPAAIMLPKTEEECEQIIAWAASTDTPFVCKSGGMSLYSTIGSEGVVVDLSDFGAVEHDKAHETATLSGSVSAKDVGVEIAKQGSCTTLPSGNTVGAIPFFLNGGNSPLVSHVGFGSDLIVSARIVTADGQLISVSEDEHPDLLYALRGAGQSFGLVTRLTVRTFPVADVLGESNGTFWSGRFIFPVTRAREVCATVRSIVDSVEGSGGATVGGTLMVGAPPPAKKPAIAVLPRVIGKGAAESQKQLLAPLYEMQPLATGGGDVKIENHADPLQFLCAQGGYKKLVLTGLNELDPVLFEEVVGVWEKMVAEFPEAGASTFSFQWESRPPKPPKVDTANSMHVTKFWANNFILGSDAGTQTALQGYLDKAIEASRRNQKVDEYVDFANGVREPPVERRYRGTDRLRKLKALKEQWDAKGRFGRQFL